MSLTGTGLLNFYVTNLEGTFSGDQLQSVIDAEGSVNLAHAKLLEQEAQKVAFQFSAGDVSSNKLEYYKHLLKSAKQIRDDAVNYSTELSSTVSWSGSASFGTAEVEEWIDEEYNEPSF